MTDYIDHRDFNNRTTLEQQLFSWEDWDTIEEGVFVFTDIVLKIDIGIRCGITAVKHRKGKKFDHAVFDMTHSCVTFYDHKDDEVGYKYALNVYIGDKLPNNEA